MGAKAGVKPGTVRIPDIHAVRFGFNIIQINTELLLTFPS